MFSNIVFPVLFVGLRKCFYGVVFLFLMFCKVSLSFYSFFKGKPLCLFPVAWHLLGAALKECRATPGAQQDTCSSSSLSAEQSLPHEVNNLAWAPFGYWAHMSCLAAWHSTISLSDSRFNTGCRAWPPTLVDLFFVVKLVFLVVDEPFVGP